MYFYNEIACDILGFILMKKKDSSVLIIDDNEEFLVALKILLSPHFSKIITEMVPDRIPIHLKKEKFSVIILDMNFRAGIQTGNEGFYWKNKIREIDDLVSIIFITAFGDVELAIKALKEGAVDYIQKSWDENKILSTVLTAYNLSKSKNEVEKLRSKQEHLSAVLQENRFSLVKGASEEMEEIYKIIEKVAQTDANILISGESGTGKEVIAREIHKASIRKQEVFVSVDLGSLHENLFESELFGHAKGAFTDAIAHKAGRIEIASGGTLFLDEISNLSMSMQMKLLTVIQNKTVIRLGENHTRTVDFRLVSASNKRLDEMVESNLFREDLLYRLKTVELELPPLRNRVEDIQKLAEYYLLYYSDKYMKNISRISDGALAKLKKYNWPGNIRELQHIIEKSVIMSSGKQLQSSDFQFSSGNDLLQDSDDTFNLENNEKGIIEKALKTFNWNMSRTAKELGINRSTLYDKLKKYEL